ncbi:uncharacterized protein LOC128157872 isoform X2 [Crassostrea angulata]|uniref:uncharacterized protein LOC128157872 isoform X2 n=1 Tax=Magallana angulata TaxID=2784310 RepID=UPI0022B1384C|nr:uncharacterized protein LOC128157872 isoform X2 [Crassostrea angulata]
MAFYITAAFLSIIGVVSLRYIDGSQCNNPFDRLFNDRDVIKLLEEVIGHSSWLDEMFSADSFTTAEADCKGNTSCRVELIFQNRNKMELCILLEKRECFSLNCTCAEYQNRGPNLNRGDSELKCNHKKKEVMSNACDKEGEQFNTTDETAKDDNKTNHVMVIESNKQNNIRNNTRGNGSNLRNKDKNKFKLLPMAIAFILGTIVGSAVSIIAINLCNSRTIRQIQNHQQTDLCEETALHSKFSCETSEYSEIPEYNRNKLGAGFREYLEPLPKNNTVSRETIPLENLYEKDESSQYQEVSLDRGNANHNIYHHLQPNNATNQQVPIRKEESSVNPLYHTLALVDRENKVDINSDENSYDAAPSLLNDKSSRNSDAKTGHIQKDEISSGSPYLMCENKEQITEKVETDEGSDELKVNSNIDNTYFVLQKKE